MARAHLARPAMARPTRRSNLISDTRQSRAGINAVEVLAPGLRLAPGWCVRPLVALLLFLIVLWILGCAARRPDDGSAFLAPTRTSGQHAAVTVTRVRATSAYGTPGPQPDPSPNAPRSATTTPPPGSPVVFLDPGHGGVDTGTIGITDDGSSVDEKTITLAIALRTAAILQRDGIQVVLSRTNDSLPGSTPADYTADGTMLTPDGVLADLQRRIDKANASGARVLLSIHMNAFDDPSVRGAETFYDASRSFGAQNKRFATLVQNDLIAAFRANGYDTPDRGVTPDGELLTDSLGSLPVSYQHLVLLGPAVEGHLRSTQMPGALSEAFYLSNPSEATAATQPAMQELIATAYAHAIEEFLRGGPSP